MSSSKICVCFDRSIKASVSIMGKQSKFSHYIGLRADHILYNKPVIDSFVIDYSDSNFRFCEKNRPVSRLLVGKNDHRANMDHHHCKRHRLFDATTRLFLFSN